MQTLTQHLHAFVRETQLTEAEWNQAIEFLTRVGHITDDQRQEFILLSDVLGVSMQTITVNNRAHGNATEATVFGPFFVDDAPEIPYGGDISGGASGEPCWVEGVVRDTEGQPVSGARIEVWEADDEDSTMCSTAMAGLRAVPTSSQTRRESTRSGADPHSLPHSSRWPL